MEPTNTSAEVRKRHPDIEIEWGRDSRPTIAQCLLRKQCGDMVIYLESICICG